MRTKHINRRLRSMIPALEQACICIGISRKVDKDSNVVLNIHGLHLYQAPCLDRRVLYD